VCVCGHRQRDLKKGGQDQEGLQVQYGLAFLLCSGCDVGG